MMAKSLRSSRRKANKRALRSRVHQPIEDARVERLSARLKEVVEKKCINSNHEDAQIAGNNQGRLSICYQHLTKLTVVQETRRLLRPSTDIN